MIHLDIQPEDEHDQQQRNEPREAVIPSVGSHHGDSLFRLGENALIAFPDWHSLPCMTYDFKGMTIPIATNTSWIEA